MSNRARVKLFMVSSRPGRAGRDAIRGAGSATRDDNSRASLVVVLLLRVAVGCVRDIRLLLLWLREIVVALVPFVRMNLGLCVSVKVAAHWSNLCLIQSAFGVLARWHRCG